MDDITVSVRQILQYPTKAQADPTDAVLVQSNGLGGPYQVTTAYGLIVGALQGAPTLGLGFPVPANALDSGLLSVSFTTLNGFRQGFNWYRDSQGSLSYLAAGGAGLWGFDGCNLTWDVAPSGAAGQVIGNEGWPNPSWMRMFRFDCSGNLFLTGQVNAAAAAIAGAMTLGGNLAVGGSLQVTGPTSLGCNVSMGHNLTVAGNATIAQTLTARALSVTANAAIGGTLNVNGASTFRAISAASGAFAGNVNVAGKLTAGSTGNLNVVGWASVDGTLEVADLGAFSRDVLIGRNASVCGSMWVDNCLQVGGNACFNRCLGVEKDLGVLGDVDVLGKLDARGGLSIGGLAVATVDFVECSLCHWGADVLNALHESKYYAPIHSPNFKGMPTGPTPHYGSNDDKLATTAFVMRAIAKVHDGVATWNNRSGHVHLELTDIIDAGGAPIHCPEFTGDPSAPTAPPGTNSDQLATTAFVQWAINQLRNSTVNSFNNRIGNVKLTLDDIMDAGGAPIATPHFRGRPTAPTPPFCDCSDRLATTKWVKELSHHIRGDTVWSWNQRKGDVTMRWSDVSAVGGAPICNPCFQGIPRAPTAPPCTDTTQIATTAFVMSAIRANPGPVGPAGPQGPEGPPGDGLRILGMIPNTAWLPTTGNNIGDIWMVQGTGEGFVWTGTEWISMGTVRGATGATGATGAQGPQGAGLQMKGVVADVTDLPTNAQQGDMYVVENTSVGWVWSGQPDNRWVETGILRGPAGADSTVPGPIGPVGPVGPVGAQGNVGPAGPQGGQGVQGNPGLNGRDGAGVIVATSPPPDPEPGQLWWDSSDGAGQLFIWYAENGVSSWVIANSAEGTAGPQGPPGPQGIPGAGVELKGTVDTYANLPSGATVGDIYIAEDTGHGWVWNGTDWIDTGAMASQIPGPQGPMGPPSMIPGPAGPQGQQGIPGVQGPQGAQGAVGPQGPAGPVGSYLKSPLGGAGAYFGVTAMGLDRVTYMNISGWGNCIVFQNAQTGLCYACQMIGTFYQGPFW